MPRFEHAKEQKFWEVTLDGTTVVQRWGKIGSTSANSSKKKCKTAADAQKAFDKLIGDRHKQGFKQVKQVLAGKKTAPAKAARNPELEAAIADDPDAEDPYLVYADWLQQQGDPRGELITVQHALAKKGGKDKKLATQAEAILAEHAATLLGPLADKQQTMDRDKTPCFGWELGFIKRARLAFDFYADQPRGIVDLGDVLRDLLAHPSGQFLRELTIGLKRHDPDAEYQSVLDALAKAKTPPPLVKLHVGDFEYPDSIEMSWTSLGNFAKVWKVVPGLTHLEVQGGSFKLGEIVLPELRTAAFRTGGLSAESMKSIGNATWPKLEKLVLWFGEEEYGFPSRGGVKNIQPLLDGEGVPKLTELGLCNATFANELCAALPKSKIAKQLRRLDLSLGTMTDEGAAALAAGKSAFGKLESLNVNDNYPTDAAKKVLKGVATKVEFGEQREPDDWGDGELHRFASVGE